MRIGITGHTNLTRATARLVSKALEAELAGHADVVGMSCLARGADQIFARVVLDGGGSLEVVLPAADYRERKVKPDNTSTFDELIAEATTVHTMPFTESNPDAYMAASEHLLDSAGAIVAVWDGRPAAGRGGTGDVVDAARERGLPVTVVWPEGLERD
ncbi:hypothetical protein OOZ19_06375 [Saccharopolyspora sp. NFXS83]|uniref:hypothetical protein n=1 Tax=Saccharopolyspora sp. NFXS83 TaxID=2993560 RepID=UPI00224AE483|nr:hypothetical protein [Saccharopolyspora sp. NFXS83]MCX2729858.1 hypothetical protein [Saccharopolyspora sp. NFXS83]